MTSPAWDPGFLQQFAATGRFSLGQPKAIVITADGKALFLRSGPRSAVQDLYELDPATGEERVLLTADSLLGGGAEILTAEELARRERMRMSSRGIASYTVSKDGKQLLVPLSGRLFVVDRATGSSREIASSSGYAIDPQLSPDGSSVACARGADLHATALDTGKETRLTHDGGGTVTNGQAEFIAQEEMHRFHGFWWSPDSRWIAYEQADTAGLEVFRIADPMHPEKEPAAWPYPRPGKQNAAVKLGVVAATGGNTTWVEWDRERYPYLARVVWPKNAPLTVLVQNREQTEEVLFAVDPGTGRTTTLLVETDAAWLNLVGSMPTWLPSGRGFLWMTERNGASQVELRDPSGGLVRALTGTGFGLAGVVDVDEEGGAALVVASTDPTERHLWRVPLAGGDPERLTSVPGVHGAIVGPDHRTMVVTASTLAGEATWTIGGAALRSVAESPSFAPNGGIETVRAGDVEMRAVVLRPRDFEAGRKYSVLLQIYGGPHSQAVLAQGRLWWLMQWYADHGYVVVQVDGRGTAGRGREWERAVKGDVIEVPLADQVAGLQALGARHPEMDLDRVGITGWSFGGYFAAMAAMRRPDVFRAAVAGAPVADWADYDTHYTERYMGLPAENPDGYRNASVLTWAAGLERPLLVIHGTADDNVYFLHSLRLTDALFRAGKPFDFVPLAGFTHMVPDPLVTERLYSRIVGFFDQHLASPR